MKRASTSTAGGRTAATCLVAAFGLLSGCTGNSTVVVTSVPSRDSIPDRGVDVRVSASRALSGWRIESREHLDLWLHGFAMLQGDSSLVPYFRAGYRADLEKVRRERSVYTQLDDNSLVLRSRLEASPNLTSAQFLPLYFASWTDLRLGCERFLRDGGDVRSAMTSEALRMYATLATYFPTSADRDWLRLFLTSLDDEHNRFHRGWWASQQQVRAPVRTRFVSMWNERYAEAFARFMRAASSRQGALLLSLPLGGEGRSLDAGGSDNFIAVNFPVADSATAEVLYTLAHEVVGSVSNAVVREHASAVTDRTGQSAVWSTLAAVRGGAVLLQRIAPELLEGYQRYYLTIARQRPGRGTDLDAQFLRIFPLPPELATALERQIQLVLEGI